MYRGRGFAGGRAGSNASRVMIDNRPKQLLVTGYEEKDKEGVVAQFAVCIKFIFCYCFIVCICNPSFCVKAEQPWPSDEELDLDQRGPRFEAHCRPLVASGRASGPIWSC